MAEGHRLRDAQIDDLVTRNVEKPRCHHLRLICISPEALMVRRRVQRPPSYNHMPWLFSREKPGQVDPVRMRSGPNTPHSSVPQQPATAWPWSGC